jgi:hypothetical protein
MRAFQAFDFRAAIVRGNRRPVVPPVHDTSSRDRSAGGWHIASSVDGAIIPDSAGVVKRLRRKDEGGGMKDEAGVNRP